MNRARWLAVPALLLLTACASLGLSAQTFNQKLSLGYTTDASITDAALILGSAGKMTPADAQNVHDQAVNLKAGLDIVRTLHAQQPAAANDKLASILAALNALDSYLKTRSTKP